MKRLLKIFKILFPFLATIISWRLSDPFWNPGGVLAIIPIFYYSFIKPANWFAPFAVIFCFLLDYKFDITLFWTSLYCLFYAANGLQNFVDLTRQKYDGLLIFMGYLGTASLLLSLTGFSGLSGLAWSAGLFLWLSILYIPFAALARRISDDRQ
ncbi:MAG: hypothetical protein LBD50_01225 [Rickettsiales bacterium]|jgi:hypothetical protein|nr:hypothetical protein [Rickettsiales bacterium]